MQYRAPVPTPTWPARRWWSRRECGPWPNSKVRAVFGDRQRPERVRSEQDPHLTRYLKRQVSPYSHHYRPLIQQAASAGGKGRDLLARLPLTSLADVDTPEHLVLRPTDESIQIGGDPGLAIRVLGARVLGRVHQVNRTHVEPA